MDNSNNKVKMDKKSANVKNMNSLPKHLRNRQNNNDKENQSPTRPKNGFVKDMCKFYSDILTSPAAIRRQQRKFSSSPVAISSPRTIRRRPKPIVLPPPSQKDSIDEEETIDNINNDCLDGGVVINNGENGIRRSRTETSPTWQSVRSQDSGFSDSCESGNGADNSPDFNVYQVQESVLFRGKIQDSYDRICSMETGLHMKLQDDSRSLAYQQRIQAAKSAFKADCNSASKLIHYINSRNRARILNSRSQLNGSPSFVTSPQSSDLTAEQQSETAEQQPQTLSSQIRPLPIRLRRCHSVHYSSEENNENESFANGSLAAVPPSVAINGPGAFSTPVRRSLRINNRQRPRTIVGLEDLELADHQFGAISDRLAAGEASRQEDNILVTRFPSNPGLAAILPAGQPASGLPGLRNSLQRQTSASLTHDDSYASNAPTVIRHGDTTIVSSQGICDLSSPYHDGTRLSPEGRSLVSSQGMAAVMSGSRASPGRHSLLSTCSMSTDPVYYWWKDLLVLTDSECMTYLQSKPIDSGNHSSPNEVGYPTSLSQASQQTSTSCQANELNSLRLVKERMEKLMESSLLVLEDINNLSRDVSSESCWTNHGRSILDLASRVTEFVFNINLDSDQDLLAAGGGRSDSQGPVDANDNHQVNNNKSENNNKTCFIPDTSSMNRNLPGLKTGVIINNYASQEPIPTESTQKIDGMYEVLLLQEKVVLQVVDRLKLCSHRSQYTPQKPKRDTIRVLDHLHLSFMKLYHLSLFREMRQLLSFVTKSSGARGSSLVLSESLSVLIELGKSQQDDVVFAVISQLDIVSALVKLCQVKSRTKEIKLLILRALSSLCCTEASIRQLEAAGGVQLICSLLTSSTTLEVKVEAAGVLAQITSPWITENHRVAGLTAAIPEIVLQLSTLASLECGEDSFLLVSAALANLTFMEPTSLDIILEHNIWRLLTSRVDMVMNGSGGSTAENGVISVFVRDQVVTILANLAAKDKGRDSLIAYGGIKYLVRELATPIYCVDSQQEMDAVERIIKKSAIALCRLCVGEKECGELELSGGVERSVQLCEDAVSRNYNDSILVACLALLRRAANFIKIEQSFVHDNLVDSFRELTQAQESYV